MINIFSTKNINIISIIISIIIFLFLNFCINNFYKINSEEIESKEIISEKSENKFKDESEASNEIKYSEIEKEEDLNWYIEIPAINLKAPIKETTNMDILNDYVGHFEETSRDIGNIGLAGHNRGYEKNYFENLVKIKKGDEIKYKYNNFEKKYIVNKIEIIKDTNWSYLENTAKNKITLITCVENKPELRRCIQAEEK